MPTPYPFESEDAYLEALDKGDGRALLTETPDGNELLDDFQKTVDSFEDSVKGFEHHRLALEGDERYQYLLRDNGEDPHYEHDSLRDIEDI